MLHSRRSFTKQLGSLSGGLILSPSLLEKKQIKEKLKAFNHLSPQQIAREEAFWILIRQAYKQSPHFINLENGYFSPQPLEVVQAQCDNIHMINETPSFYMRTRMNTDYHGVKLQLASLAGCSHEEIAITRNTTESLNTIVMGIDWKEGDEVVVCDQDYMSMQEQFLQQQERRGIVVKYVNVPLHPESDQQLVEIYEKAISPKTRMILVTHLINISGQVMPVRKIADMAHRKGVEVMIDGAHSFAHLDFKIPELGGDYFGCSLHKWLCCPLGAGLLYVKKDKIPHIWPLFGDRGIKAEDIRKFEQIGTRPSSTPLTISNAIKFHEMIGTERKAERLKYLQHYWVSKVRDLPKVTINTPKESHRHGAIANIAVEGMSPKELSTYFYDQHRIFTVAINRKSVKGVRVTPHLYTSLKELDTFVEAIKSL